MPLGVFLFMWNFLGQHSRMTSKAVRLYAALLGQSDCACSTGVKQIIESSACRCLSCELPPNWDGQVSGNIGESASDHGLYLSLFHPLPPG